MCRRRARARTAEVTFRKSGYENVKIYSGELFKVYSSSRQLSQLG